MSRIPHRILVTGATSAVGGFLIPALTRRGCQLIATSRGPATTTDVRWIQGDLQILSGAHLLVESGTLVHLAPIFVLPELLPRLIATGNLQRLVALSSTSVLTKVNARSQQDRQLAQRLEEAERSVMDQCARAAVPYTLLRPTLIYGGMPAGGLGHIKDFINRFGVFPLAGEGKGLRQPVHAEDVARACEQALMEAATHNRIYAIPGGEVLAFHEMVRRIFIAQNRKPRLFKLPVAGVRVALACLRWHPRFRNLTPAVAERMNHDMVFDYAEATRDFGYHPRRFTGVI